MEGSLTDGILNPTDVWGDIDWIDPPPPNGTLSSIKRHWAVANTGGSTVVEIQIALNGLFGVSIDPAITNTIDVGRNPTGVIPESFYPDKYWFAASAGTGNFLAFDYTRSIPAAAIPAPGILKVYSPYKD